MFTNASFPSFENEQKFTIYQLIYVINELVSSKKFTNARSLLSIGLLLSGSTVLHDVHGQTEIFDTQERPVVVLGQFLAC